jgi:hypothetical protein
MKVKSLEKLEDIVDKWNGEIVIDAYEMDKQEGIAILSLMKDDMIQGAIRFEGDKADMIKLFTDILKKNIDKVVVEQKLEIKSETIKRNLKKLRHNP